MRWKLPWLVRAVWDPVDACDLVDKQGKADHGKVVPFLFLVVACVLHVLGMPFSWYELLALGSLSFGYGAWRTFLASRAVTGTFTDVNTRAESKATTIVRQERDVAAGIDPAP